MTVCCFGLTIVLVGTAKRVVCGTLLAIPAAVTSVTLSPLLLRFVIVRGFPCNRASCNFDVVWIMVVGDKIVLAVVPCGGGGGGNEFDCCRIINVL